MHSGFAKRLPKCPGCNLKNAVSIFGTWLLSGDGEQALKRKTSSRRKGERNCPLDTPKLMDKKTRLRPELQGRAGLCPPFSKNNWHNYPIKTLFILWWPQQTSWVTLPRSNVTWFVIPCHSLENVRKFCCWLRGLGWQFRKLRHGHQSSQCAHRAQGGWAEPASCSPSPEGTGECFSWRMLSACISTPTESWH